MHAENWGGTVRSSLQPVQRTVFAENSEHKTVFCKTGGCRELFLQRTPNSKYGLGIPKAPARSFLTLDLSSRERAFDDLVHVIETATPMSDFGSGSGLSVETLPTIVHIATLPLEPACRQCLHLLLELCFFRANGSEDPPFMSVSVSNIQGTVTVIADTAAIDRFAAAAPNVTTIDETDWSVVRVGEGALGFEEIGVVERLTQPLAQAGIPVLYQSTYSTDYILIPRDRLDEALRCLLSAHWQPASRGGALPEEAVAHAHAYPLTVLRERCSILRLEKAHRQRHTGALIRLLFMPQASDAAQAIASLTETDDEISLIAGASGWWAAYCESEAEGLQHDPQVWVPIRVGDAEGIPISATGVIAAQSKVLANEECSILYLSTFHSDFTLVQHDDVERASLAFERAGFTLCRANEASDSSDCCGLEASSKQS